MALPRWRHKRLTNTTIQFGSWTLTADSLGFLTVTAGAPSKELLGRMERHPNYLLADPDAIAVAMAKAKAAAAAQAKAERDRVLARMGKATQEREAPLDAAELATFGVVVDEPVPPVDTDKGTPDGTPEAPPADLPSPDPKPAPKAKPAKKALAAADK